MATASERLAAPILVKSALTCSLTMGRLMLSATGNCGYISPENLVAAGGYEPQYQQFASRDTLKLVETARDALFETRNRLFPPEGTGEDAYPDNQNLPLVNLPGGVKASKWQK